MSCLHVKRLNWLIALLIVLITLLLSMSPISLSLQHGNVEGAFQMGFYDLMSQKNEVYNVNWKTTRGALKSNITKPDDNRFVLKWMFTPTEKKQGRIYFNQTPIFFNSDQKGLMIDGLVDQLMYANYWMEPISCSDKSLIIGQNGSIFVYPMPK